MPFFSLTKIQKTIFVIDILGQVMIKRIMKYFVWDEDEDEVHQKLKLLS